MEKRLLIINNRDSFTYNLVDLVRRLDVNFSVVNVEDLDLLEAEHFSHFLISPGPDVPSAYPQLFALLNQFYWRKPILGVCLGHQTLCQFFGAKLENLQSVRHGQSRQLTQLSPNPIFSALPISFQIGLYHSWAVSADNFPSELEISARCDDGVIMAVQHRYLPLYGVQFHPESYISEFGEQILRNWLKTKSIVEK